MLDIGRLVLSFGTIFLWIVTIQILYIELCRVKMVGLHFTCVDMVSRHLLLLLSYFFQFFLGEDYIWELRIVHHKLSRFQEASNDFKGYKHLYLSGIYIQKKTQVLQWHLTTCSLYIILQLGGSSMWSPRKKDYITWKFLPQSIMIDWLGRF